MILLKPSFEILTDLDRDKILQSVERAGRTCYKSESKITKDSASEFVKKVIGQGHESVIEHESIGIRFVVDRGVTHELVRHRLCAFSQESTRYCDYSGEVAFVIPPWVNINSDTYKTPEQHRSAYDSSCTNDYIWFSAMMAAEVAYKRLRQGGWTPQQARSVLPNSLKTEIVCTANLREWRHIFKLRTSKAAHPQMQEIMIPTCEELVQLLPEIFSNL